MTSPLPTRRSARKNGVWIRFSYFLFMFFVCFFVVVAAAVIAAAVAGATRRPRLTVPTWGKPGK